jgi:hypothetical protein
VALDRRSFVVVVAAGALGWPLWRRLRPRRVRTKIWIGHY